MSEFNVCADSVAAARVYALTSLNPSSTMPLHPTHVEPQSILPPYPRHLSRTLRLTLFPVDITEQHTISREIFESFVKPLTELQQAKTAEATALTSPSPLASWLAAFMQRMFAKMEGLHRVNQQDQSNQRIETGKTPFSSASSVSSTISSFQLHDPVCIWYLLSRDHQQQQHHQHQHYPRLRRHSDSIPQSTLTPAQTPPSASSWWILSPHSPEDIRVETTGQWTRGMTVIDRRRTRRRRESDGSRPHDQGNWLGKMAGNRVDRVIGSPQTRQTVLQSDHYNHHHYHHQKKTTTKNVHHEDVLVGGDNDGNDGNRIDFGEWLLERILVRMT